MTSRGPEPGIPSESGLGSLFSRTPQTSDSENIPILVLRRLGYLPSTRGRVDDFFSFVLCLALMCTRKELAWK